MKVSLLLVMLLMFSGAYGLIRLVSPVDVAFESLNGTYISPVGPGNEIALKFKRETSEGIYWDELKLLNKIEPGWKVSTSSDDKYLYYNITVPAGAKSGEYPFRLMIVDYEGLMRSEEAVVKLFVTNDPSKLVEVKPFSQKPAVFADEDGTVTLEITNKALSVAPYKVVWSIDGMPFLERTKTVKVWPNETVDVPLAFKIPTEGKYTLRALVLSPGNLKIHESERTTVFVKPTITSKLRSIGQGFPFIPMTMAPFYAVLGLFSF